MFNPIKWARYPGEVGVGLHILLAYYPGKLETDLPHIKRASKHFRKEGWPPFRAAACIAAEWLSQIIENIPAEARDTIREQLKSLDLRKLGLDSMKLLAEERRHEIFDIYPGILPATILCGTAIYQAEYWHTKGELNEVDAHLIKGEVIGSLIGVSAADRTRMRIERTLDQIASSD